MVGKDAIDTVSNWCHFLLPLPCHMLDLNLQIITWTAKAEIDVSEYWIALMDNGHEGVWKWDDGSSTDLQNNKNWKWWRQGEPNNKNDGSNSEDFAAVGWDGSEVGDLFPYEKRPVLCVKGNYQVF